MQRSLPCLFMRRGTSRGPFFNAAELPADTATRDLVLLAVMGSPDKRQIDGLGGRPTARSATRARHASTACPALRFGRFGGIAGSFLVADLARRRLAFSDIFSIVALAGGIATIALKFKQFSHPETAAEHTVALEEAHAH